MTRRETRRRVLAAATAEFAERGYVGATVARIADRADVAVPTLYSAWGSKRALLRGVMAEAVTGNDAGFDNADRSKIVALVEISRHRTEAAFIAVMCRVYRIPRGAIRRGMGNVPRRRRCRQRRSLPTTGKTCSSNAAKPSGCCWPKFAR